MKIGWIFSSLSRGLWLKTKDVPHKNVTRMEEKVDKIEKVEDKIEKVYKIEKVEDKYRFLYHTNHII